MNTERANHERCDTAPQPNEPPPLPGYDEETREEYVPLGKPLGMMVVAETILKHPDTLIYELHHEKTNALIGVKLGISVLCLLAFGCTVGMFSGGTQLWAAPVKITAGVLLSALLCIPSLFVFSCLSGADSSLPRMVGTVAGVVTVSSLLLLGLAPVSWVFAQSTESVVFMGVLYLAFLIISLHYGLQYMRRSVVLLNGRQGKHLAIWSVIFVLVVLQMSTTLRPIVGTGETFLPSKKMFFSAHWIQQLDTTDRGERLPSPHEGVQP